MDPTDLDLIRSAARGENASFHTLVDRHAPELFRLAASLSRTRADAEDVVQETLIGAYQGLKRFDGRASVKTWMKRILVRQAARAWNRSKRSRDSLPIEASEVSPPRRGMPDATLAVDRQMDIGSVVRTLAREHREVIVMREFQDMSYTEMAEVLGVPIGTIESRLFRARAELRREVDGLRVEMNIIYPESGAAVQDCPYISRIAIYHDKELSAEDRRELEGHLSSCDACRRELEAMRELSAALAGVTVDEITPGELSRVHRAVDESQDHGVLRIATAMSAIAASILIISSVWLYDVPTATAPIESQQTAVSGWEALATTGRFEAPAGSPETGLASRDDDRVDWMLRVIKGQDPHESK